MDDFGGPWADFLDRILQNLQNSAKTPGKRCFAELCRILQNFADFIDFTLSEPKHHRVSVGRRSTAKCCKLLQNSVKHLFEGVFGEFCRFSRFGPKMEFPDHFHRPMTTNIIQKAPQNIPRTSPDLSERSINCL